MKIEEIRTIKVSKKVFAEVKKQLTPIKDVDMWLETFTNCREQGYVLVCWGINPNEPFRVWACEDRHTDDIVVYWDNKVEGVNNKLTDAAYNRRRYFKSGQYVEAGKYIKEIVENYYLQNK